MTIKKAYFFILAITLIKYGFAITYCLIKGADFGSFFVGYDELEWQGASTFFYKEGITLESVTLSMGQFQSFNVIGWPLLMGVVHTIVGHSYYNVIYIKALLFFFAGCSIYTLLLRVGIQKVFALISVVFLSIYYPLAACDITYLRDDVIVYLIIIALRLSINMKGWRLFIKIPLLLLCSYFLVFSRPMAFLVYIVLNLFYFKINKPTRFFIIVVPAILILSLLFDIISYGYNFLLTFRPSPISLLFNTFKFYIGPLPWNMFYFESEYEPYWYIITLPLIIFSFLFKEFYLALKRNWKVLLGLYVVGFLPYAIGNQDVDLIGPRQFAMSGFFLFIILYHKLITNIIINSKTNVATNYKSI